MKTFDRHTKDSATPPTLGLIISGYVVLLVTNIIMVVRQNIVPKFFLNSLYRQTYTCTTDMNKDA